jgi:hypothetical protein
MTAEVPGGDFDDNIQLLWKIVREWGGWRQSLTILRQAIKNKTDFGAFKLQPALFNTVAKHMKKTKEKRTPKLLGVVRKLFLHIEEFKRFLKIDTWNEDKKLALKDVVSHGDAVSYTL